MLSHFKSCEESLNVLLVRLLSSCKAGFVHAVIDIIVCPLVVLVNLLLEIFWVKVDLGILLRKEVVELRRSQDNSNDLKLINIPQCSSYG